MSYEVIFYCHTCSKPQEDCRCDTAFKALSTRKPAAPPRETPKPLTSERIEDLIERCDGEREEVAVTDELAAELAATLRELLALRPVARRAARALDDLEQIESWSHDFGSSGVSSLRQRISQILRGDR